jgi:hypothetical protein
MPRSILVEAARGRHASSRSSLSLTRLMRRQVLGTEAADLKRTARAPRAFYLHGYHTQTQGKHISHRSTADTRPTSRPTAARAELGKIRHSK